MAPILSEPAVLSSTPMPAGYVYVPKGDIYITKNCRNLTQEASKTVYIVQSKRKKTLGIRVPANIHNSVKQLASETATTRASVVQKRDNALEQKMRKSMLELFPRMPSNSVDAVLSHTLKKRSGRVGRSGKLEIETVLKLAVRAHVRHRHTDYDSLIRKGTDRDDARRDIEKDVAKVLKDWGWIEEAGAWEHGKTRKRSKRGQRGHQASNPRVKTKQKSTDLTKKTTTDRVRTGRVTKPQRRRRSPSSEDLDESDEIQTPFSSSNESSDDEDFELDTRFSVESPRRNPPRKSRDGI